MEGPVTIFITYLLESKGSFEEEISFGYKTPIHCNYIEKITTEDYTDKTISISFNKDDEFKFMAGPDDIKMSGNGYGWSANVFYILMQIVEGIGEDIKPEPHLWRKIIKTDEINNFQVWNDKTIPPDELIKSVFIIRDDEYDNAPLYDLSYLNYPLIGDETNLQFGEEVFLYGNIKTKIAANIFSMTLNAVLPLNEFNTSQNPTWEEGETLYITEIGIYDDEGTLLGIGKLNTPIDKNNNIHRTIEFKLDF
jgi:hypothetical protein